MSGYQILMDTIRVGLIGTGSAAKSRANSLVANARSHLFYVAGQSPEKTAEFSQAYEAQALESWQELVKRDDVDLVIVSTINSDHGAIATAALNAGKHVVVEYPLALSIETGEAIAHLAQQQKRLLHVEHIELLSGVHGVVRQVLQEIGQPFSVRYESLNPQHPAPQKWTYQKSLFGFPLVGAVSRLHRLTNLFGAVASVYCQARFWGADDPYFTACLCTAQLTFTTGLVAELIYGKGDTIWRGGRSLEIRGDKGAIFTQDDRGLVVTQAGERSLDTGSRRGLFAQDTAMVVDHLLTGAPLYVSLEESLAVLRVADAARRSAELGEVIRLP
jgi:biliverdin reductase